jgi:hypothetical protein
MIDLFYTGGLLFMSILTIILTAVVSTAIFIFLKKKKNENHTSIRLVKEIGIFGLVVGIFAQFIGLYQAFSAIEQAGSVLPSLLIEGLKVSSITTLYGFVIFLLAWLLYFGLKAVGGKEEKSTKVM